MGKYLTALVLMLIAVPYAMAQDTVVPHYYNVLHYDENIQVNPVDSSIIGDCNIFTLSYSDTLANVWYNIVGLTVDSVLVEDIRRSFIHDSAYLYVALGSVKLSQASFHVHVFYHGKPKNPAKETWGGVYFGDPTRTIGVGFAYPGISMTRFWMPCYDLPDIKATANINITVPQPYVAASNGALLGADTLAGYITYHWQETHPIATYLMCIAVGHYAVINMQADNIPVSIYALVGDSSAAAGYFRFIPGIARFYEQHYGAYPFDKIGYALVPALGGGMEHQSMISLDAKFVYDTNSYRYLAAHELSHQWWGDMVTPVTFGDAWLNEGFATFSEALYYEYLQGPSGYLSAIHTRMGDYLNFVANPASNYYEGIFPLYDYPRAAPSSNYPATIYYKGASVLGMLRWMLGDSVFFNGMRNYGQQNEYGNVTTQRFEQAMEFVSGENLKWFFDEWVYKAGWPILKVGFAATPDSMHISIIQQQDTTKYPLFQMPFDVRVILATGDTITQRIQMAAVDSQTISFSHPAGKVMTAQLDPDFHVLAHVTTGALVAVNEEPTAPASPFLSQNFPNPVVNNESTTIHIAPSVFDYRDGVTFGLYDMLGREVRDLTPLLAAHNGNITFSLDGITPGVYYYALTTPYGYFSRALTITR
ncbi:MAG TPA: M1 family aminopeptidase [Candidatus Kapabacteria bacterium]|nr:M1 family aminopeptidase [Candidatus Kapabacteria bacterium]